MRLIGSGFQNIQKLTENFIEKHSDKIDWVYISIYQKLTEPFIEKNKDKVVWDYISQYQKLSNDFFKKHKLEKPKNNWLYISPDERLSKVKETGLYEIQGDYVIAYKGIRDDRYSAYNFQHKYEKGGVYDSHADYNCNNENSFGLSAWTEEKAMDYCNELVIKVKIHKDDLAALVHNGGKIRCSRFEVLD